MTTDVPRDHVIRMGLFSLAAAVVVFVGMLLLTILFPRKFVQ